MDEEEAVLDASALIALLHEEPGSDVVEKLVRGAYLSTVNLAEVLKVAAEEGRSLGGTHELIAGLGIKITPFTADQAEMAARIELVTRKQGLSLADRACLALAHELRALATTADRSWAKVEVGVEVKLIR